MKTITARRSSLLSLSLAVLWPSCKDWHANGSGFWMAIRQGPHLYCTPHSWVHSWILLFDLALEVVIEALVIIIIINIVKPLRLLLRLPRVTLYGLPPFTWQRRWAWHPGESVSGRLLLLLLRFQLFFTHCWRCSHRKQIESTSGARKCSYPTQRYPVIIENILRHVENRQSCV